LTDFHLHTPPSIITGPLTGKGIVITRPLWQAAPLAESLAKRGAVPFIFPAIVIEPNPACDVPTAQMQMRQCTKAFFVSANAVQEGLRDLGVFPEHVVAYGPGPGTAHALAACGAKTIVTPSASYDTAGVLALPELQRLDGERVMVFTGVGGKGELAAALRARGATVDLVECYVRRAPETMADGVVQAWREARIHAQVLTSAQGIANFSRCLVPTAQLAFLATPAFVPHPNVAAAAQAHGLTRVITTAPGDEALMDALDEFFSAA
jgi:uroporphyrinogen-III synthase